MTEKPVLIERENGLVILTLNRADAYNAIDGPLVEALLDALIDCDEDSSVRAVMITGIGKAFCAGGNLKAMKAEADIVGSAGPFLKKLTVSVHGVIATIARMEKPVIAAVNGERGLHHGLYQGRPLARRRIQLLPAAHRRAEARLRPDGQQRGPVAGRGQGSRNRQRHHAG
jgi:2-(1,2-epoxy-1,2-dihydrophenyl)acetyl-CoA isomerase